MSFWSERRILNWNDACFHVFYIICCQKFAFWAECEANKEKLQQQRRMNLFLWLNYNIDEHEDD